MYMDGQGWKCLYRHSWRGMSRLRHQSGRIETYSFPHSTSLTNSCYSLLDGTDGTLWVGGMSGLYLFDKQTGELSQHPLAKKHKKLENVLIYTLFRDSKGRIWIGTEESLFFVCRRETGRTASFLFGLSAWVDTGFLCTGG